MEEGPSTPRAEEPLSPSEQTVKRLQRDVKAALKAQGFRLRNGVIVPPDLTDKQKLRELHSSAVAHRVARAKAGLRRHEERLVSRLAGCDEVDVERFSPTLTVVERDTQDELLFRWAALHWSIPVSSGYGRRLRFLVTDSSNNKLVGVIGLGDPVFALASRDDWVGWDIQTRRDKLHHVADAFVLGAVPPYSHLLAGKLVALLAASDEVRREWHRKYGGRESLISGRPRDGNLAMITTTSALGRSSVYNRLLLGPADQVYVPVGSTRGSGDFHFSDGLHRVITDFALEFCEPTAKDLRWGTGFRNRREVVKKALPALGFSDRLLYHGVQRQVFVVPLARNVRQFLSGGDDVPNYESRPAEWIADWFKWRWMRPRSISREMPAWDPETWRLWS